MNVFLRELRAYRKSTLIWIVSLSLLAFTFLLMFTAFSKDVEVAKKLFSNLPQAIRSAMDISLKNFFTIYGYFGYIFTPLVLAGAVQAMNLGVGVVSKEESGKTVDFLLSKPVSRMKVVTSKLSAVIFLIIVTNIIFTSVAFITAKMVSTVAFSSKTFLMISAVLFLIQIFFLALGLLMSVIIPKVKSTIAVALPTVFVFFIVGMLGAIIGNDNVKYLSPFKFYEPNYIIDHGMYDVKFLIIEAVFVVVAIILSYVIYIKKDIRAVS